MANNKRFGIACANSLLSVVLATTVAFASPHDQKLPHDVGEWFKQATPSDKKAILAHPKLLAEAQLYLVSCQFQTGADAVRACHNNQMQFVEDYIDAFYNHHTAQQNVAFDLDGEGGNTMPFPGVQVSHLQGCAWRLAIVGSGGPLVSQMDTTGIHDVCSPLSHLDQLAAERRAQEIDREILVHLSNGSSPITNADSFP
ncbi:MAG: hypothetical protein PHT60_00780 [Acidiphilium sp.]|nr:hypothetical protein [Acidiphilium sp.]MDD4934289.1 hypothetical protein [Acidiphilium sp.]